MSSAGFRSSVLSDDISRPWRKESGRDYNTFSNNKAGVCVKPELIVIFIQTQSVIFGPFLRLIMFPWRWQTKLNFRIKFTSVFAADSVNQKMVSCLNMMTNGRNDNSGGN